MRIALLGNQNNNFFSLVRYLRDRGYDADLLLFDNEEAHFHPLHDTFDLTLPGYVKQLSWGNPLKVINADKKKIAKDLEEYDCLIGCGSAPAIVHLIGRKLDLFLPYGFDLYHLPRMKVVNPKWQIPFLFQAYHQKKGIRDTPVMMFDRVNEEYERFISKLNYPGDRIKCTFPYLYTTQYEPANLEEKIKSDPFYNQMEKLRKENDYLFSHPVRHVWVPPVNQKSNDVLIRGYKLFVDKNPAITSKLILFEYGRDVNKSKELIEQLGIGDNIVWMPTLPRKSIMMILHYSDLIIGELFRSWITYGGACEAMAMSIPLMHYRNDEDFAGEYDELYPMINANTDESVFEGFQGLLDQPAKYKNIGIGANQWFEKHCIQKPLQMIINIIDNCKAGKMVRPENAVAV